MAEPTIATKTPISFSIPIDPETLNRQLQASARMLAGKVKIPNFRLPVLVPAGVTATIPFPLPNGFVCTRRYPLRFESNYYDPNITVEVYCDRDKVTPFPMSMTGPFEVDFGVYYVKKERVDIVITNGTNVDILVTIQVTPHLISKDLYEEWYEPLVKLAFKLLDGLARGGL